MYEEPPLSDIATLAVVVLLLVYALASRRLQHWWISMPMAMVVLGYFVGSDGLGLIEAQVSSEFVTTTAEATLAFMLFRDAVRIDLGALQKGAGLPERLLGIGLPVMLVVGTAVALGVLPGIGLVGAALVATMLAPTDAALGEEVVSDRRLPMRLRQGLNVESGLNDGLVVPVFLVMVELAKTEGAWDSSALASEFLNQVGFGLLGGVLFGGGGGLLVRWATARETMGGPWGRIAVLLVASGSFVSAAWLGGSGFIGAFVGGVAFGITSHERGPASTALTGYVGTIFDSLSFLLFGALLVPFALHRLTVPMIAYAVISLVAIRMISVFVAMLGSGMRRPTKAYMGWFGPRGLATVVFSLVLLDEAVPHGDIIASVAIAGVAISVYAHGLTASPLTGAYARWYAAHERAAPGTPIESAPVHEHPIRSADRG